MKRLLYWASGIRLYIAIGTALVTAQTAWWAHAMYGATNLYVERTEEIYAWISVGCLLLALLVGPTYKLLPRLPGQLLMRDARRMIGLSAAWFGTLHVVITYFDLFRHVNPLELAASYQWSFLLGTLALTMLLVMASISTNAAMKRLGVWWFRLQQLAYAAGLLIVVHAVLVGTHAKSTGAVFALVNIVLAVVLIYFAARRRGAKS